MIHVDDDTGYGVTTDPEVTETTLTPADEYFVMACDGLWDVVSNEEAVAMIKVGGGKGGVVETKRETRNRFTKKSTTYGHRHRGKAVCMSSMLREAQEERGSVVIFSLSPFAKKKHSTEGFRSPNSLTLSPFVKYIEHPPHLPSRIP